MTALIRIENLSVDFPGSRPVIGLGLSVRPGETMAIVGESGSGKSMTALAIMGLLPRNGRASGSIHFDGQDLLALPERNLRRIRGRDLAMIFQEPMTSLNPVVPIGRQIAEVLRLHEGLTPRAARARAIELLDLVRIPDAHQRVDEYAHQLSGGMRQRVMIAMAVACRPKLLIADEPTTALDVTIQAQVLALLDNLRREFGMALLLITHDLSVVTQWADRVVVMYAGRKVEEAQAEPLFANPLHPYTRGLLAASPRLATVAHYRDGPLREIPGSIASAAQERGCPFRPRCAAAGPGCGLAVPDPVIPFDDRVVACPVVAASPGIHHAPALGF